MKTFTFLIIGVQLFIIYSLFNYIIYEGVKTRHAEEYLIKRLRTTNANTKDLIRRFEVLPTQCNQEIKDIIKHFKK